MAAGLHGDYPPSCRSIQADSRKEREAVMDGTGELRSLIESADLTPQHCELLDSLAVYHGVSRDLIERWLIVLGIASLEEVIRDRVRALAGRNLRAAVGES